MRINEEGQIRIPVPLRNHFGIDENAEVDIVPADEGILIKKREQEYDESLVFVVPKALREHFGIAPDVAVDIIITDEGLLIQKREIQVSEEGLITIPGSLREDYGITPDVEIDCWRSDEGILIKERKPGESPLDKIRGIGKLNMPVDEYMDIVRGRV
jgi:bifunctional DNA-binding transcriptional regulator/antitoxin component of YhaV-PrlF toxin-antitoxin module